MGGGSGCIDCNVPELLLRCLPFPCIAVGASRHAPLTSATGLPCLQGVRFNAEKKQVGQYHSTRIWSFKMTSPCCQHTIEVHTDPKASEYIIVSGARR